MDKISSVHLEQVSCLFIALFRSLESYLISWTLKPETQPNLITGDTLLCLSTTHPLYISSYMFDFYFFICLHCDLLVLYVLGVDIATYAIMRDRSQVFITWLMVSCD